MRLVILLSVFLLSTSIVMAGSSVTHNWSINLPPTDLKESSLYSYLYDMYSHFNQAQVVTTNPNGNLRGNIGNFVVYNNSGTYQVCFEVTSPNGTNWKCANLT